MSIFDLPDDEWDEIEPAAKGKLLPNVQIRLTIMRGSKALAFVSFRGDAREWIAANEPRFRAQIGGAQADRVRIVPDARAGRFEPALCRGGTLRLSLGHVTAWPNEVRAPVACQYRIDTMPLQLIVVLPPGFARATVIRAPAASDISAARVIDRRPVGPMQLGDPDPGRSALDQRKRGSA